MRYRRLGDSGVEVSEICLGTWVAYGDPVDRPQAEAVVDAAFDAGINFFDTANVYSYGRAEEFIGSVLAKRPRDSYILATKLLGEMPNGDRGLSRAQIRKQIDDSLSRLRTDYVDLYQAHSWDADVPLEEQLEAFDEVVRSGKAQCIGVSNWTGEQIGRAVDLCQR
jgi:aryl-alcohol dehydrogenase-like predicted oxidoreductase